jgi:excisionase family DNA binding protein
MPAERVQLLRAEEVAEALSIGRTKVFELIRTGELRSVKVGGARRVSATALAEYVAELEGR